MRNIFIGAACLIALAPSLAVAHADKHADSFQIDCSAFQRTGPTSFSILRDTTVSIARPSQTSQITFDPSETLSPGSVVVGHNHLRYDVFDLVRGHCEPRAK